MPRFSTLLTCGGLLLVASCGDQAESTTKTEAGRTTADFIADVFYEDDGTVCQLIVSIDPADASSPSTASLTAYQMLSSKGFQFCDGGKVESLNVVTVRGLDEYDQPDWSNTTEHHFFTLSLSLEELEAQCNELGDEACARALTDALQKSS
ncbi:MAG: hypothetical protein AAFY84_12250 [Pseudomonadota bacterium]